MHGATFLVWKSNTPAFLRLCVSSCMCWRELGTCGSLFSQLLLSNDFECAQVALAEGHCLADTLFGGKQRKTDYSDVPTAVFRWLHSLSKLCFKYGYRDALLCFRWRFKHLYITFVLPTNLCRKTFILRKQSFSIFTLWFVSALHTFWHFCAHTTTFSQ
jgi:hypothetical protein